MTEEQSNKLEQLIKLSASILMMAIDNKNLEEIGTIEQQRNDLIKQFFLVPVNESDSQEVADAIKNILKINEKVVVQLEKNKQQLTKDFNKFKTSQKATNAYLSNI